MLARPRPGADTRRAGVAGPGLLLAVDAADGAGLLRLPAASAMTCWASRSTPVARHSRRGLVTPSARALASTGPAGAPAGSGAARSCSAAGAAAAGRLKTGGGPAQAATFAVARTRLGARTSAAMPATALTVRVLAFVARRQTASSETVRSAGAGTN